VFSQKSRAKSRRCPPVLIWRITGNPNLVNFNRWLRFLFNSMELLALCLRVVYKRENVVTVLK
jgi:hypothetical protein